MRRPGQGIGNRHSPSQEEWYNAVQALLPTLIESRLKSWGPEDINLQHGCLFYSGRIPQEITDLIFEFALSPDTRLSPQSEVDPRHDFCVRYDHETGEDEPDLEPVAQQDGALTMTVNGSGGPIIVPRRETFACRKESGFDWFRPDNTGQAVFSGCGLLRTCRRIYLHANKHIEQARDVVLYSGREAPWGDGLDEFIGRLRRNYTHQLPKIRSVRWFAQMCFLVSLTSPPGSYLPL